MRRSGSVRRLAAQEQPRAIGAFNLTLDGEVQIHLGMPQRPAATVTGDDRFYYVYGLKRLHVR